MDELTAPRVEMRVRVGERRVMGVSEFGPADGRAMVWFHGTPGGARQIPEHLRRLLDDLGVRLIVVERPGYGRTTDHQYGRIRDVADDLEVVLDRLRVGRFGVGGLSGGGPYALAAAHDHADRVVAAAVVGTVAPHTGPDAVAGGAVELLAPLGGVADRLAQPVGRVLQGIVVALTPVASPGFDLITRVFPEGDRRVFDDPAMKAMFIDDIIRTVRGGLPGPPLDLRLFLRDWGFRVSDLAVPVHLWHGDADPIVPLRHAEHLVEVIPDARLTVQPGESHLGGFATADDAVRTVMGHWDEPLVDLRAVDLGEVPTDDRS